MNDFKKNDLFKIENEYNEPVPDIHSIASFIAINEEDIEDDNNKPTKKRTFATILTVLLVIILAMALALYYFVI